MAASSPLIGRLFTPVELGEFGVFMSVATLGWIVGCLRIDQAITLPETNAEARDVVWLALMVAVGVATTVGVLAVLTADFVAGALNVSGYAAVAPLIGPTVLLAAAQQPLTQYAIRRGRFRLIGRARAVYGWCMALLQVGAGLLDLGTVGLCGAVLLAWACAVVVLAPTRATWTGPSGPLRETLVRYRTFPLFGAGAGLLNQAALEIPGLLIPAFFGAGPAGHFAVARRIAVAPSSIVGLGVSQVYLGEAARLRRVDADQLARLFRRATARLASLGIVSCVAIGLAAPLSFDILLGDVWRESGVYVALLAPLLAANLFVPPATQTLVVLERQDLQLQRDALRLAAVLLVLLACGRFATDPRLAVVGYGFVVALMHVASVHLAHRELRRLTSTEGQPSDPDGVA